MPQKSHDELEELLAQALAAFDDGGDRALAAFVERHPDDRTALQRGLARCKQMGLLGQQQPARDFPDRLGEFRLLRRLGSGGMGVVYEAEQESLNRRVALKVIRPELLYFEGARERFRREIEAVARLSHPAVVPVLASGEQDGVPWYAMELLGGRTVHDVCTLLAGRDPAALSGSDLRAAIGEAGDEATDPFVGPWWQVCTRVVHAVALGVRHAHLRGIVHRDIKPSNIMLMPDGRTVLLDFGIAMVASARDFTRTGNTPGSPAFMSPEQLRGLAVDERTDVYSLAASLWQMLTLVPPFQGVSDLQRIRDGEAPSVRAKNREVPRELELAVRTAMDRDRERRYADVEAFAADLLAVLQRRPIQARQLGVPLRAFRWCQRHRVAATLLACTLVGALLLPALLAWQQSAKNLELAAAVQRAEQLAAQQRATNTELAAAVRRADESFTTTLDTIDKMLVTLANDRLRFVPAATAVTVEALEQARTMYSELLARHPDHQRLRHDASGTTCVLAATLVRLGQREQAIALLRDAIAMLGGDTDDLPPSLRKRRAVAWANLATVYKEFQGTDELRACLLAAERDHVALGREPEHRAASLFGLGNVHSMRANLPEVMGTPAELVELREGVRLTRESLALAPGDVECRHALIRFLDNLATALADRKDLAAAEPLLDEALALARALPDTTRIWPPSEVLLSDVLETLAGVYMDRKDARAAGLYEETIALREAAAKAHPEDIDLTTRHGAALHNLARTLCGNDAANADLERALALLDRAIEVQRRALARAPTFDRARQYLMRHVRLRGNCLARLGRRTELVAVAEELATDVGDTAHLRATARFWLRAAEMADKEGLADAPALRERYEQRALDALLAAERAGWDPARRVDDAVYRPLADRSEFQALRRRIEQAASKQ